MILHKPVRGKNHELNTEEYFKWFKVMKNQMYMTGPLCEQFLPDYRLLIATKIIKLVKGKLLTP